MKDEYSFSRAERGKFYHSDAVFRYPNVPVTIDPEIMSGTPVFRGTRVPVQTLFDYIADGYALEDFLDQFPTVEREDAIQVLEAANQ
jgi:uncharacterized protein (DUF433 family)